MNSFEVEITSGGRSGKVIYKEQGGSLSFWWEFSTNGAFINLPSEKGWDSFCEKENAVWAKGGKSAIVERVAEETKRQRSASAKIEIQDEWINLYF